jgi:hypothetical protein
MGRRKIQSNFNERWEHIKLGFVSHRSKANTSHFVSFRNKNTPDDHHTDKNVQCAYQAFFLLFVLFLFKSSVLCIKLENSNVHFSGPHVLTLCQHH